MTRRLVRRSSTGYGRRSVVSRRSAVARTAMHVARRAAPYVAKAFNSWRNSKSSDAKELSNPVAGVESGFAAGHNAFTKHKRISRVAKRKYKKRVRFENRVRSAVQGVTKFQQFFTNAVFGAPISIDAQDWWEIPIMCGDSYVYPGTSTDANNTFFRVFNDEGDYVPSADLSANALASVTTLGHAGTAGAAIAPTSLVVAEGKFLVYGYELEYQFQNVQAFPIEVEIFELDCFKDYQNGGSAPFNVVTSYIGNQTLVPAATLVGASNINQQSRYSNLQLAGSSSARSPISWGATPLMFGDAGQFMRVSKSHIHVLDSNQVIRLSKKFYFKKPIRFQDMNQVVFKRGVSHLICGSVRSAIVGYTGAGTGSNGNLGAALANVTTGAGGFTHTWVLTYQKRFMIKPLQQGNVNFGVAQITT